MRISIIIAAFIAATFPVISCEKYDVLPPKSIKDNMPADKIQLPSDARDVSWDREGSYWELSYETGFGANKTDVEVYFDAEGNWVMTKTDMRIKKVPAYIKDFVKLSPDYAGAVFSDRDAEFIERPEGNSYVLEVIVGRVEMDLEVTEEGEISIVY